MIGLTGHAEGDPDDPFVIVPGALLDRPLLLGRVDQDRREDLQVWNFLHGVSAVGATHPIEVSAGDDPPDRRLSAGGEHWAVELTELTIEDVRRDLAQVRSFGREVEHALHESPGHEHLRGRVVQLSMAPSAGAELPRPTADLKDQLLHALQEDKGYVGEGTDLSGELPEKLPMDRGFYGEIGPLHVLVNANGTPTKIMVSVAVQSEIHEREAVRALAKRIAAKDESANEMLLVSCGLPDERGYTCPIESFIFQAVVDAQAKGALSIDAPTHLAGVALHVFPEGRFVEVYRRPDAAVPWSSQSADRH